MSSKPRSSAHRPNGIGLGLRWELIDELASRTDVELAFLEVSPENYFERGGHLSEQLERLAERMPILTHGLTLSLAGTTSPEPSYWQRLREQVTRLRPAHHSDHLCFSTLDRTVLHELLPCRQSRAAAQRAADRMREAEDRLGVPMAAENISWYARLGAPEISEVEFLHEVLERSGGGLLLDVNNVYVNAVNHGFDALTFLDQVPYERVVELHVAGHEVQGDGRLIDTHGAPICPPVYALLEHVLRRTGPVPVLLERDNSVPALDELLAEVQQLEAIYASVGEELGWREPLERGRGEEQT